MQQISQNLIEAMEISMHTRENLLTKFTADDTSEFMKIIKDVILEQLVDLTSILGSTKDQINFEKCSNLVQCTGKEIKIKSIDELIAMRNNDISVQMPSTAASAKEEP